MVCLAFWKLNIACVIYFHLFIATNSEESKNNFKKNL